MADDNVTPFPQKITAPVVIENPAAAERVKTVLENAMKTDLEEVIVVGVSKDENGIYMAASSGNRPSILWLLEFMKRELMNGDLV